jgi:hypothetical protein
MINNELLERAQAKEDGARKGVMIGLSKSELALIDKLKSALGPGVSRAAAFRYAVFEAAERVLEEEK